MKYLKILNLLFVLLIFGGIGLAQETEQAEINETMEAFDEPIITSNEENTTSDENELEEELNETELLTETELEATEEYEEDYDEEYAVEIPNVPEEDLEEAKTFAYPLGAELRMLQLEKAIERNIASGELIIEEIKDENLTTETDALESILDELRSLLEEVKSYDFNQGKSSEEMALDFVELKAEARELTTLFRETATNITGNMHLEIRERVNERIREFKESQQREINELKNRYNKRVMEEIAVQAGLDDEVTEKIRQGNINVDEYKETLKEKIAEKGNNIEKHAALNNMVNMNVRATQTKEMTREQGSDVLRNVEANTERIRKNVEERAHKEEISGSDEEVDEVLKQDNMNSNDKRNNSNNSGDEE
ncbi:MAG: hypothetical protein PWQ28_447 [Candidatus Woesearchaeota archaeon]|nr:hypothetical protein [Candidatus Woesearchaeota archaeon]MDK2907768.1 hypothetical protein [Candidatus Woesearchaeota archaeon]